MAEPMSRAERVGHRRAKLRAAGLRPVQIWVPDIRAAGFAEECRRQSRLIRDSESYATRAEDEAWEIASGRLSRMMRGDLVVVSLPGDHGKPRPALVIQSDLYAEHPSVTVPADHQPSCRSAAAAHRNRC